MKKLLVIISLLACITVAKAQPVFGLEADISTSDIATIGIGANASFAINDQFTITPSFIYFLPKSINYFSEPGKWSTFGFNADAHYTFAEQFYAVGGLSYMATSFKFDDSQYTSGFGVVSSGGFGLNLGVGGNLGNLFAEAKYNTPLAGLLLTVGYRFGEN